MKTILIVEDEAIEALHLKLQLEQNGFAVSNIIATGEDAVEYIDSHYVDCILMDITLAGDMDGIEAAKEIIKNTNISIIFITGYDDNEIKAKADEIHSKGFFNKPIDLPQLLTTINA